MRPPKSCCVDEISALWTDEQLILYLKSIQRRSSGAPLPLNVVADINPFVYEPANLPEGIWYVVYSKDPKQAKEGFWKARGDPCEVYSDSSIVGWRTTLEFYKGHSSNGQRTDWVMQEYSISDDNKAKGASTLCRVFLSEREGVNERNGDVKGQINLLHDDDNKPKPLKSKLHDELEKYQANLAEGDFLELEDLNNPSSSSSSGNSSCVTPASDLYFDSDALLRELKDDKVNQPRPSSYRLSVSRPNDTVIITNIAAEESRISGNEKGLEAVKVEASNDAGASSRRQTPGGDRGKRATHGKLIKKFFCFMAF